MNRISLLSLVLCCCLGTLRARAASDNSVSEIDLRVRGLEYDPFTQMLYATSADTNSLLQIDPVTGAITRAFDVAARPSKLALSGMHGLWIGINGAGAVQRFNLDSFTPEDPILIAPDSQVKDIAPSPVDPYTLAVTLTLQDGSDRSYFIRNGQILPQTATLQNVALLGSYVYGTEANNLHKAEIGPNGFASSIFAFGIPVADVEAYGDYIYHPSGRIRRASDLQVQLPLPVGGEEVAINKTTEELLFLSGGSEWTLHQYDLLTKEHTGVGSFGTAEPSGGGYDLVAWSTNRAAFRSENKLYLLRTDTLFLPAELEVVQSIAPTNPVFGSEFTITLVVTNKSPKPALEVSITNYFAWSPALGPERIVVAVNGGAPGAGPGALEISANLGDIPAGGTSQFSITVLAKRWGRFTNAVAFGANNDFTLENNTNAFVFDVQSPAIDATNGVVRFARAFVDANYDAQLGVIGYDGEKLWPYDPERMQFGDPFGNYFGAAKLAASPRGGALYVGAHYINSFTRGIARIPGTADYIIPDSHERSIQAVDLEVSPQNNDLVAISFTDPARLALFRNGTQVGEHRNESGKLAFSSDGSKLYLVDAANCGLSIYSVRDDGLHLDKTIPAISCTDFAIAGGLLFFDSGLVYDPVLEQPSRQVPTFVPPAFFAPSDVGFDVLGRTNGVWVVRRFRLGAALQYEEYALRTVGTIANPVLDAFAAGPYHIAFRTSSDLYVADLPADPNAIVARISRSGAPGRVTISFPSTTGSQYRIESKPTLGQSQWTAVRDNIDGTGAVIAVEFDASGQTEYFRVAR